MTKELNNPTPGSEEEKPEKGTEEERLDEGGEKLIAGKFKSQEELVKAYEKVETELTRKSQESSETKQRLAKLEGRDEEREKQTRKIPQVSPEERKKMEEQFRQDFNKDALGTLFNYQRPFIERLNSQQEEIEKLRNDHNTLSTREEKKEMLDLADSARSEDPEGFAELEESIDKELRENETWTRFENPYQAVFYHLKGKSTTKLAKSDDAERRTFVEGPSDVPPDKDKKKQYVQTISKARTNTRL